MTNYRRTKPWIYHHQATKLLSDTDVGETLRQLVKAGLIQHVAHKPRSDAYRFWCSDGEAKAPQQ